MLGASGRVVGRLSPRVLVGVAAGVVRGWSERGIGRNFGCEDVNFGYNIRGNPHAQSHHTGPRVPMSAAWLLNPRNALLIVLALVALFYIALIIRATTRGVAHGDRATPSPGGIGTGFVTNFLDTLGIGSFATTTTIFRLRLTPRQKTMWALAFGLIAVIVGIVLTVVQPAFLSGRGIWFGGTLALLLLAAVVTLYFGGDPVDDQQIPGTLNFGHTLPTIAQAFIFTTIVPVDPKTLILLIAASVLGAWVGAGVVARWSRKRIQFGMGVALLAFAGFQLLTITHSNPTGGTLLELTGAKLAIAFLGNLMLGALMTLGIGLYAPCMIMIYLLGMNPTAAFPIMMGSCAFLMPVASARFVRERSFDLRASLGLMVGGVPAVLLAALIVKSLPLTVVRWLVLVVVIYTAIGLIRASRRFAEPESSPAPAGATPDPLIS